MRPFFLLFALVPSIAGAGNLSLSFGPTLDGAIGTQKVGSLGYEFQWGVPSLALEVGTWNESNGFAFFGSVIPGIHIVTEEGLAARIGFGPAVISQTDDRLSSLFEFHIQAKLGLEQKHWATGVQFDHYSNAGIVPPNLGRDIAALYIGIPL